MLREVRNDLRHLLSILQSIGKIRYYTQDINDIKDFLNNDEQRTYNACLTMFTNIGENVSKLSDKSQSQLDSEALKGTIAIRHRIAHAYTSVDSIIIWNVITNHLKTLDDQIYDLVNNYLQAKLLDENEILVSRGSEFFRFVDFERFSL